MTRKQLYRQIAAFTDDWKDARRKANIFDENCAVMLKQVESVTLSFGKFLSHEGKYHGENRNTLHFHYKDRKGKQYVFSIID